MQDNFALAKRVVQDFDGSGVAERMNEPVPGDSKKLPPLQAADLLAYETGKEVLNRCDGREVSRALARLVAGGPKVIHIARCLDFGSVQDYLAAVVAKEPPRVKRMLFLYRSDWPVRAPSLWGIR